MALGKRTSQTYAGYMNRVDRLFGILLFLQSKKYVTADQIAQKFGMSVRTVYRDIKALGEQGVPISFEPNKGYCIVQGYFLPPVSFTSEEANALMLMESFTPGFADKSIGSHYANALNKIRAVLKESQKEKLESLKESIKFQFPDRWINDFEYLSQLQQNISARLIISIGYKNSKEEITTREVEPIGLIFYAFAWHLIAWCHLRKEYRDFKVLRIIGITNTGKPFQKESHISVSDYMKTLPVAY